MGEWKKQRVLWFWENWCSETGTPVCYNVKKNDHLSSVYNRIRHSFYVHTLHFYCLIFIIVPTNALTYITILNYITNAPTCFCVSSRSSGSSDIVIAKVIKYKNYQNYIKQ